MANGESPVTSARSPSLVPQAIDSRTNPICHRVSCTSFLCEPSCGDFQRPDFAGEALLAHAPGIQGLKVTAAAIPDGQTQGKIVFALSPDAAPGRFAGRLTATANYNEQKLSVQQSLDLTIEAVVKP